MYSSGFKRWRRRLNRTVFDLTNRRDLDDDRHEDPSIEVDGAKVVDSTPIYPILVIIRIFTYTSTSH